MPTANFLKDQLAGSVPEEIEKNLVKDIVNMATAFRVCATTSMSSDKKVMPVLTDTGTAFWTPEGEIIGNSGMQFEYPKLEAMKLGVIVPVTKEKSYDSVLSVVKDIQSGIADAFARAIDAAIFFGKESVFDNNIYDLALAKTIESTANIDADISKAMGKVEAEDRKVTAIITHNGMKQIFRDLRDVNNNALMLPFSGTEKSLDSDAKIYGTDIYIPQTRSFDRAKAEFLVGDFSRAVIGTRQGIEYELLREATVGDINLAERDMIAVKCTMRLGFNVTCKKAFARITPKTTA